MFGADFKRRRERLRLTQIGAAKLFGVSIRTIRNWENEVYRPPAVAIYAFDAWDAMTNDELDGLLLEYA